MKTNLTKLNLNSGFTYGVFLGSIDTYTGTDFCPEIVDFYRGIDGLYYSHGHEGIKQSNVSDRFVSRLMNCGFPAKKRGKHSRSSNKENRRRNQLITDLKLLESLAEEDFTF